jgi:hypothetical protein
MKEVVVETKREGKLIIGRGEWISNVVRNDKKRKEIRNEKGR